MKNETLLKRVNARLEEYIKNNRLFWEIMTERSRTIVISDIMQEEMHKMEFEEKTAKEWLEEVVERGGCLIEDISNTVYDPVFIDGNLSHIRHREELVEIDWKNSLPNYREGAIVIFGWDKDGDYCVYRFRVVVPFVS